MLCLTEFKNWQEALTSDLIISSPFPKKWFNGKLIVTTNMKVYFQDIGNETSSKVQSDFDTGYFGQKKRGREVANGSLLKHF